MKKITSLYRYFEYLLICGGALGMMSCDSYVPEDIDALGDDVQYNVLEFSPYLGRTTTFENIVAYSNASTLPLTFNIAGVYDADGNLAPEVFREKYPVTVWKDSYTGEESSMSEIQEKMDVEYRPLFEMQHKSGNLVFWNTNVLPELETAPGDGYTFDVAIENTGGRRYQRNLKLRPLKPRAYEPSQYDNLSGLATMAFVRPSVMYNVFGTRTGYPVSDVRVYLNKDEKNTAPGSTITFSVLDSLNQTIDIQKFNRTDWDELVHGFNRRFENGKVTYDVLYPMPLIEYPTKYTNPTGNRTRVHLQYNRIGFGGEVVEAGLVFDFAIFEAGHWEVQFRFAGETPKFENE